MRRHRLIVTVAQPRVDRCTTCYRPTWLRRRPEMATTSGVFPRPTTLGRIMATRAGLPIEVGASGRTDAPVATSSLLPAKLPREAHTSLRDTTQVRAIPYRDS